MAVTKKNVNGAFYFKYPSNDVFLKERNYFVFEGVQDDTYIKTVKIGNKTLNFGRYALDMGAKFYLDVSAYYAKYFGKFNVVITYENGSEEVVTNTTSINAKTYDCYSPYTELEPRICNKSTYICITPPYRMLFMYKSPIEIHSLFIAKRDTASYWEIDGVEYKQSFLTIASVSITKTNFIANLRSLSNGSLFDIVERIADFADTSRELVYVTWRTRWGIDVSHIFYLDTFATGKYDAKEVESEYYYKEHSKHVIKGSFYLDNIREPYDLWYYQTLANSELVTFAYNRWLMFKDGRYIPNGTNDFNGVKITGCNIKDAVVDGVAQSTITFDFEMR